MVISFRPGMNKMHNSSIYTYAINMGKCSSFPMSVFRYFSHSYFPSVCFCGRIFFLPHYPFSVCCFIWFIKNKGEESQGKNPKRLCGCVNFIRMLFIKSLNQSTHHTLTKKNKWRKKGACTNIIAFNQFNSIS